ncbi:MAG: hypothetical protein AAF355_07035 [Myxococcota bacterium]
MGYAGLIYFASACGGFSSGTVHEMATAFETQGASLRQQSPDHGTSTRPALEAAFKFKARASSRRHSFEPGFGRSHPEGADLGRPHVFEIYGNVAHEVGLTLGSGGAGASGRGGAAGLLRTLAEDFLEHSAAEYRIAWVKAVPTRTLANLKHGVIDIALSYDPELDARAIDRGWASQQARIFNEHLLIVGPRSNPARLRPEDSAREALAKIATFATRARRPVFLSRNDGSSHDPRERKLWRQVGLSPHRGLPQWRLTRLSSQDLALREADNRELYHLTDRGTFLRAERALKSTRVFVQGGEILLRTCNILLAARPTLNAQDFAEYLQSPRAQTLLAEFGKSEFDGRPLFTPARVTDFREGL